MIELEKPGFDTAAFLSSAVLRRKAIRLAPRDIFFSQGEAAESVFFLETGRARVTVVSAAGKEATIMLLASGDFVGEEALATKAGLRSTTATAITACTIHRISRREMVRAMREEHGLSGLFLRYLLERSMRVQADLVDQLVNSSEKRLARVLLAMAELGKPGEPEQLLSKMTQETLAEMIGTTRSRVNFFMNRFRKLGLIEYNGRIKIHRSRLNLVLLDQMPERTRGGSTGLASAKSASQASGHPRRV